MGSGDGRRIDAFVSYSRAADSRLAPSIQRGLTRLARKWYRIRALNVFRDQTDLSASHALGASIERALADARFFVLLASPAAAESKWVGKEIEFWQRNRTSDTFLIALTDGTIRWDDEAGDFDWSATDALPRSLSGYFEAEPLWQDLTWSRDADRLSLWHGEFRDAVATLAAPIHGSSKRALDNAEVKEHRALVLVGALAMALILTLAISFGIQFWFATAERNRANANARDATVMSAIQEAQAELANAETGYDVRAYRRLMAARSLAGKPSVEGAAYDAALDAAYARPNLLKVTEVGSEAGSLAAMTVDGRRAALGGKGQPTLWNPGTGRPSGPALEARDTTDSGLLALAFSRDGRRLAAAYDTVVVLWDVESGKKINEFAKDHRTTASMALSPDGTTVAVAGGGLRIWDTGSGKRLGEPLGVTGDRVVFSPDGRKLAFDALNNGGTEVHVRGLDADDAGEVVIPYPHDLVSSIAFAPDGGALAVGTDDGGLQLRDPDSGEAVGRAMSGHQGAVRAVTFSADGSRIATAGADRTIRQWNAAAGSAIGFPLTGHAGPVDFIAFSRGGGELVSLGEDATLRRWDARNALLRTGPADASAPEALAVDPRGKKVAVGSAEGVRVFNQGTGAQVATLDLPQGARSLSYAPDGTSLLIVSADGVRVWEEGSEVRTVTLDSSVGPVSSGAFMPWGRQIVVGSYAGKLLFEDLDAEAAGTPSASIDIRCSAQHLSVSQDGMQVAYACGDTGGVADAKAGSVRTFEAQDSVTALVISPDGRTLIIGTRDGTVWRQEHDAKAFVGVGVHRGAVLSLAHSPDGRWFASAGDDGSVVIHPPGAREISARISAHTGPVEAVAFSRDGGRLFSLGADKAARVWHVFQDPPGDLCERITYNMSESDWKKWISDSFDYRDQCAGKPRAHG
ncbi:TIR domain-containing protein [Streptomyces sp. NPDC060275]|uniref:TIR domain-containing protein n=1 Tax=Streptomyces sp. NPDC060275 TaxID=3347090 RepID=UPI003655BD91